MTLCELAHNCKKCELSKSRTSIVLFSGSETASIMLIGEAPGADEDKIGLPFVGRAGKFLTSMLEDAGFNREKDLYITNIVKCRPPNNRKPKGVEVEACAPYLAAQIEAVRPKVIVLVGSSALEAFIREKTTITNARGKIFEYGDGIKLVPIFHPSYLLRNHSKEPDKPRALTILGLKNIKELLKN